jgi:acetylornithine/N-succinyldiaminopimelate aminotransferase
MGLHFKNRLVEIASRHANIIAEVRGEGLMLGLRCNVPNTDLATMFFAEKFLAVTAGENVVRLLPPLIVTETEIEEACAKIDNACMRLNATLSA